MCCSPFSSRRAARSVPAPLALLSALSLLVALSSGCKRIDTEPADPGTGTTSAGARPEDPGQQTPDPANRPAQIRLASLAMPSQLSNQVAFEKPPLAPPVRRPPPMGLTASDGSGLELNRLEAKAVIDGPLAFTELKLRFHNPEMRRREGRFSITLPAGAAVSRFAMRNGAHWMEGEVVEKQRARQVYEDFLHRKQDPAILEQDAGNVFSARVFPIEAGADKELILSWSQELADAREAWSLPLNGLPLLDELQIDVFVHSGHGDVARPASTLSGGAAQMQVIHVDRRGFSPHDDFVVWPGYLKAPWDALRSGEHVVARVQPPGAADNDHFERLLVLFDTSASGAVRWELRLSRLKDLLRFAGEHGAREAVVIAFDQGTETVFRGRPEAFGDTERARLDARHALGASDLGGALRAARQALAAGAGEARVILFGDGMATLGERDAGDLVKLASALGEVGVARLDAVTVATARDDVLLKALTGADLKRRGVVLRVQEEDDHPFDRLALRTFGPIEVQVPGAEWVHPRVIEGLQAGQQALIYARLAPQRALQVQLTGGAEATLTPRWRPGTGPMLERATVKARIDRLLLEASGADRTVAQARQREALLLSLHHRVLCRLTALLVLESEGDYARYGIDRKALADVMVVSSAGIAVRQQRRFEPELFGSIGLTPPVRPNAAARVRSAAIRGSGDVAREKSAPAAGRALADRAQRAFDALDEASLEAEAGSAKAQEEGPTDAERQAAHARPAAEPSDAPMKRPAPPMASRPMGVAGAASGEDAPELAATPPPSDPPMRAKPKAEAREEAAKEGLLGVLGAKKDDDGAFGATDGILAGNGSGADVLGNGVGLGGSGAATGGAGKGVGGLKVITRRSSMGDMDMPGLPHTTVAPGQVRLRRLTAQDGAWATEATRAMRRYDPLLSRCLRNPGAGFFHGVWFEVNPAGRMEKVQVVGLTGAAAFCMKRQFERLRVPRPRTRQRARALYDTRGFPGPQIARRPPPPRARPSGKSELEAIERALQSDSPWRADYGRVQELLRTGHGEEALEAAWRWRKAQLGDVMALVALGDAARARADLALAQRAWGSIIDLYPSRADTRRFAGDLLQGAGEDGLRVAIDTFRVATEQRPDHPTGHHLLAMALAAGGQHADALDAVQRGLQANHRGTARAIDRVLRDDAADIAAAWARRDPGHKPALEQRLKAMGATWVSAPRLRVVLTWETDANDVDLHVFNAQHDHTFFKRRQMPGGLGEMYKSAFGGYGPEAFVATNPKKGPWRLFAYYYRMGPMGWGMGQAQVIRTDGVGGMVVQARPYVLQRDKAWIDLGTVEGKMPPVGG